MTEDEASFKNLISTRQKSRGVSFLSLQLGSNFIITYYKTKTFVLKNGKEIRIKYESKAYSFPLSEQRELREHVATWSFEALSSRGSRLCLRFLDSQIETYKKPRFLA